MFRIGRYLKRTAILLFVLCLVIYLIELFYGEIKSNKLPRLTELDSCPACYGVSICPELYSNVVKFELGAPWTRLFNSKNVFYGVTKKGKRVVLKKLAHDWEFSQFDSEICKYWNQLDNCKPKDLLNVTNLEIKLVEEVKYDLQIPSTVVRTGLILCPYAHGLFDMIQPVLTRSAVKDTKTSLLNVWTMLKLNPEPIILQLLPRRQGWPVPSWGGACGRLTLVSYAGEPLSMLTKNWMQRLQYAKQILQAAMDFTFKHDRYRFFLMDWSLDNIVADEKGKVSFVDLEDTIVLDKHIAPSSDLPLWYERYHSDGGQEFTFSISQICRHHLSDHNIWAACFLLAGEEGSLLKPIPKDINASKPYLDRLLNECIFSKDRFKTVDKLQQVIDDILDEKKYL